MPSPRSQLQSVSGDKPEFGGNEEVKLLEHEEAPDYKSPVFERQTDEEERAKMKKKLIIILLISALAVLIIALIIDQSLPIEWKIVITLIVTGVFALVFRSRLPTPEFTPRNTSTGVFEFWRLAGPKETRSGIFYSLFHPRVELAMYDTALRGT